MTNAELAELRGEMFGVKVILFNCLSFIAGLTDDPVAHLDAIQAQALDGIMRAEHSAVRPQHLRTFQNAAAGIVVQAIEGSKAIHTPVSSPAQRQ
jgi:hypothetical protein